MNALDQKKKSLRLTPQHMVDTTLDTIQTKIPLLRGAGEDSKAKPIESNRGVFLELAKVLLLSVRELAKKNRSVGYF